MKSNKKGNRYITAEEDMLLGEIVRTAMRHHNLPPSGTKCPAPEVLRKMAFHEELDVKTLSDALLHLPECYKCVRLTDAFLAEYREQKRRKLQIN